MGEQLAPPHECRPMLIAIVHGLKDLLVPFSQKMDQIWLDRNENIKTKPLAWQFIDSEFWKQACFPTIVDQDC